MAASLRAGGNSFGVAPPVKLFPVHTTLGFARPQSAVDRRGRFLVNSPRETAVTTPITLLLNWNPAAKMNRTGIVGGRVV